MTSLSFENSNTGSTKLQYDDTSTNDYVVTLPHASGELIHKPVGGVPYFSATKNTVQTVTPVNPTKVDFTAIQFDSTGAFSLANDRFTPLTAGYYQIDGCLTNNSQNTADHIAVLLYKNGAQIGSGSCSSGTTGFYGMSTLAAIVYLNGTTDYIEMYGLSSTTSFGNTVAYQTMFQAHLIVGT